MAKSVEKDLRGIVRPSAAREKFSLQRWAPDPPLDRFIDRFWKTAWDLDEPFTQPIVTYPAVNLVFQADGSAVVSGIQTHNDGRRIEGKGWALAAMFRLGGFAPFSDRNLAALVDQRVPAAELFGPGVISLADQIVHASTDDHRLKLFSDFLTQRAPTTHTPGEDLSDLVEAAVTNSPAVTRVADLATRAGMSVRTLQRLFHQHVGVGPKLVLERYRLQAAGEAARQPVRSWSDVAHQLGYSDQAHLTSDVSKAFGQPPATYARAERAPSQ
jgi:AraC-like DNA-binding protein